METLSYFRDLEHLWRADATLLRAGLWPAAVGWTTLLYNEDEVWEQLKEIKRNQGIIQNIKQNYFKNRKYYSHLPPIIHLTEEQEAEILEYYGHFFSASPPETLSSYVFNGTEYKADPDPDASAPVGFEVVCPSTSVYEDILFTVNDINEVLQMIQMESFEQWVLNETCDSTSGNVVGTVCLERERLIDAVVINLETTIQLSNKSKYSVAQPTATFHRCVEETNSGVTSSTEAIFIHHYSKTQQKVRIRHYRVSRRSHQSGKLNAS
ncbi:hypothetical protein BSL78_21006 [Apostichopus japonicus]|uniref:Uncharacterized protein n=1 Tax=Stichopus japonicus TaxID=307972 RepID=A0A2G8K2A1_STIJA|nr:hypothetical protein BSL78_21006 [Apostichopus japonicus]